MEIIQDAWDKRNHLHSTGNKRRAVGRKLWTEGDKLCAKGYKLCADGDKLHADGDIVYINAVFRKYGSKAVIDWSNGKVTIEQPNAESEALT